MNVHTIFLNICYRSTFNILLFFPKIKRISFFFLLSIPVHSTYRVLSKYIKMSPRVFKEKKWFHLTCACARLFGKTFSVIQLYIEIITDAIREL